MRDTIRYVIRERGAIRRELHGLDITIDETIRSIPDAPSRALWYKVDQGRQTLPRTARGIAQAIVQMERAIHPDRPNRDWTAVLAALFEPVSLFEE